MPVPPFPAKIRHYPTLFPRFFSPETRSPKPNDSTKLGSFLTFGLSPRAVPSRPYCKQTTYKKLGPFLIRGPASSAVSPTPKNPTLSDTIRHFFRFFAFTKSGSLRQILCAQPPGAPKAPALQTKGLREIGFVPSNSPFGPERLDVAFAPP